MSQLKRFIRLPDVISAVGLGRTSIYDRIKAGTFPASVQLGPRAVAWDAAEIAKWQQEQIDASRRPNAKKC